jgi:hypothetical protein
MIAYDHDVLNSTPATAGGLNNPTHLSVEASKDAKTTTLEPVNSNTIPSSVGASDVVPVPMGEPEAIRVGSVVPTFQVLVNSSLPMNLPLPANLGLPLMAPLLAASANLGLTVDSDSPQVTSRKGTIMRPNPQSTTAR